MYPYEPVTRIFFYLLGLILLGQDYRETKFSAFKTFKKDLQLLSSHFRLKETFLETSKLAFWSDVDKFILRHGVCIISCVARWWRI